MARISLPEEKQSPVRLMSDSLIGDNRSRIAGNRVNDTRWKENRFETTQYSNTFGINRLVVALLYLLQNGKCH